MAGHGAEVHFFVPFPANLIIEKVLVIILLILFFTLVTLLKKCIELLAAETLLTLEVLVQKLQTLLLIVRVRVVGVALGLFVL